MVGHLKTETVIKNQDWRIIITVSFEVALKVSACNPQSVTCYANVHVNYEARMDVVRYTYNNYTLYSHSEVVLERCVYECVFMYV